MILRLGNEEINEYIMRIKKEKENEYNVRRIKKNDRDLCERMRNN